MAASRSQPSLYPTPNPPQRIRQQQHHHHESSELLPPGYQQIISLQATVTEQSHTARQSRRRSSSPDNSSHRISVSGSLRVLQGPVSASHHTSTDDAANLVHAFLSIETLSLPLTPDVHAADANSNRSFLLNIRHPYDKTFLVKLHDRTESHLVDGFKSILQWFCTWAPDGVSQTDHAIIPASGLDPTSVSGVQGKDRFGSLGDRGVHFVEQYGNKIQDHIERKISQRRTVTATASEAPSSRVVTKGTQVTSTVLSGASSVVGKGAKIASKVSDKVATTVATGITRNPVSRSLADAPRGSARRRFVDDLQSGAAAFGRIYLAADQQGRLIIETTTDGTAGMAGDRYGQNAERATKSMGRLAVDGYRIFRFPQKLGATAMLKSAVKTSAVDQTSRTQSHGR